MSRARSFITVPLSKLVASRRNVRRVKPERDAHRRLVASIRAHGLLAPLVVRPSADDPDRFVVIAGNRRHAALREIHHGTDADPPIACLLRAVDDEAADALSLAENFPREAMHPLDEAEAFAKLAGDEGKHADAIAADFGVSPAYIRQRMKLATLHDVVKLAYRENRIDTGTAEAFAAVPPERQAQVWEEVRGNPRHADHVRNVIAHDWIDAAHALFDLALVPEGAVSRDLFSERVLVERKAFMDAQAEALKVHGQALTDEGWADVIVAPQTDVQDRLYAMDAPPPEYDAGTTAALKKLNDRRQKWEAKLDAVEEGDDAKLDGIQKKLDELDAEETQLTEKAPVSYGEATKAVGTAFLLLDPDGRVRREYRLPRHRPPAASNGSQSTTIGTSEPLPTSDDLRDSQLATTFAHQAIAVRQALLQNPKAWKRVLVLALHEKVRKDAIAIRVDVNATNVHVTHAEGFTSPALEDLRKRRMSLDPFAEQVSLDEPDAYAALSKLSETRLDELIALLTVECLTSHPQHRAELVHRLARELTVNVRDQWRPDAVWLDGYKKVQLVHLIGELLGPVHRPDDQRKKSDLVQTLVSLFSKAADGTLEDAILANRVNAWFPSNLRD